MPSDRPAPASSTSAAGTGSAAGARSTARASSGAGTRSRRDFLKTTGLIAAGGSLAMTLGTARSVHAAGSETLKIGLIGCGGRGTGAAADALSTGPGVTLTAIGDLFADRLESSLSNLKQTAGSQIDVADDRKFVGFDAFKGVIGTDVDVVLLTTPPHFRPIHLKAAIDAGKHVFAEKPVAVDAPGVRSVLESVEAAKQKNLAIVSGLCWRYDFAKREIAKRIHEGQIGDVRAMHVSYNTGTLWHHDRQPNWTDMEYQVRNWLYYTWLSGDFNTEQHVHGLDKASWIMHDEPPVKAYGLGGRQVRTQPQWGHIYDHMAVVYEYPSGARLFANCRQMAGCSVDVSDHIFGTKGTAEMMGKVRIEGENPWQYKGETPNMYQQEHKELFASIRSGQPINNGLYMARSSMLGIMGRMVCYTGQTLTWDECLASQQNLSPASYEFGPAPEAAVAMPGLTSFS